MTTRPRRANLFAMTTTTDLDAARRALLERSLDTSIDIATRHEAYHPDAVLEFPQSGERFEGVANFLAWRERYPEPVEFTIRRITGSGDLWVGEAWVSYSGGPPMFGVAIIEFDGMLIRRERIYGAESWEAPEWRRPWRSATPAE